MDRFSAMTLLHDEAIYLHQGTQFQVEKLDWEEKKAFVREVDVDYFTDANLAVQLKVLEVDKQRYVENVEVAYGDVTVQAMATIFKKIKFETHENIGSGPIHLPEEELHTSSAWISLEKNLGTLGQERLEQGLIGVAHTLKHIAPLHVMCDPQDVHVVPQLKAAHNEKPTIFFYDRYPGGVGLSERIYFEMENIIKQASNMVEQCRCETGCPSCIGMDVVTNEGKSNVLKLLALFSEVGNRI
jgi:DEAD/DEAH box helicase domain-containing protein